MPTLSHSVERRPSSWFRHGVAIGGWSRLDGVVIVITGPIASGKSTIAKALAAALIDAGVRAAVIDLDVVHDEVVADGAPADDDAWTSARRRAAAATNALASDGVDVVIAEGSYNRPGDREAFDRELRVGTSPVYIALRVSYEGALRRARGDPTRGRSRDASFLAAHFASRAAVLAAPPATDIVIDTERTTAAAAAAMIVDLVRPVVDRTTRRSDAS